MLKQHIAASFRVELRQLRRFWPIILLHHSAGRLGQSHDQKGNAQTGCADNGERPHMASIDEAMPEGHIAAMSYSIN